jgi:hypothetical protein
MSELKSGLWKVAAARLHVRSSSSAGIQSAVRFAGITVSSCVVSCVLRPDASVDASCCASAVESSRVGDASRARFAEGEAEVDAWERVETIRARREAITKKKRGTKLSSGYVSKKRDEKRGKGKNENGKWKTR